MAAAMAICAALVRQRSTGTGERIDVAMADVLATWTGAARPQASGVEPSARSVPGYGVYATRDGGSITLGVISEDHFWTSLCDELGLSEWRTETFVERMRHVAELQSLVAARIAERDADELVAVLTPAGVPVAPVLDRAAMVAAEQFRARGTVTSAPWADTWMGYPVAFAGEPGQPQGRPPDLDEHRGARFGAR
jgi:crotonobetainyl-CoA:carnitine CoA-transferase CaiB-like acyl-CoA transferase